MIPLTKALFSESKEVILNLYEVQATILRQGRMHTQAIRHALKGIDLARIDRMYDRAFELWTTLGSIYNDQNKLKLAEICFLTALKFKKLIKKEKMLAYVYTQLGFLYEKDSNSELAEEMFLEALKYSRTYNNVLRETEALMALGKCYLKQNKSQKALEYLQKALDLAKEHSLNDQKNKLLLIMGEYLVKKGDPRFETYALDFFYAHLENLQGGDENMVELKDKRLQFDGEPPEW